MFLDTATRKLQIILALAKTSADCPVVVDWVDIAATTSTPGMTPTVTNGVTAVDIVAAPGSGQRKVNGITVNNIDTGPITATIRTNDNGTLCPHITVTLQIKETLGYTDVEGWYVIDAAGGRKLAGRSGRYLRTTVLTAGTSFVTGPETNTVFVRVQGPGGGGGGIALNAAGNGTVGGGGCAGSYAEKTLAVAPNTAYTYAIGAGGAAGASGGGTGGAAGGATTFSNGVITVTAPSGLGGTFLGTAATHRFTLGGASGATATNGDVNQGGMMGRAGHINVAGVAGLGGGGGDSTFGTGGAERTTTGAGAAGTGFGAGGSGALSLASGAAQAGGAGTAGVITVDEFA
jgi:hypothetical protein